MFSNRNNKIITKILEGGDLQMGQMPMDQPPINQPPMNQPPMNQAFMSQQPMDQAFMSQPPINQPPMDQPPMDQMSMDQELNPIMNQPPMDQMSMDQELNPIMNQPPMDQSFSNENYPNADYLYNKITSQNFVNNIKTYVCAFTINKDIDTHFVKYIVQHKDSYVTFSSFIFEDNEQPTIQQPNPIINQQPNPIINQQPNPAMNQQPNPIINQESNPIINQESNPIINQQPNPIMNQQPNPAMNQQPNPIMNQQPNPIMNQESNPIMNQQPNPIMNQQPNPAMNQQPNPIMNHQSNPAMNQQPNPAMNQQPNPAMNQQPNPAMNQQPNPAINQIPGQNGGFKDESTGDENPLDTIFKSKVIEFVKTTIYSGLIEPSYIGYIPNISEQDSVFVFVKIDDAHNKHFMTSSSDEYFETTPNELFNLFKVFNFDVEQPVKDLFTNNPWLYMEQTLASPFTGYLCKLEGTEIKNTGLGEEPGNFNINIDNIGDFFYFSFLPLDPNNAKMYQRYALLPMEYECILDNSNLEYYKQNMSLYQNSNSIYFKGEILSNRKEGNQFFAIRSPTQFTQF